MGEIGPEPNYSKLIFLTQEKQKTSRVLKNETFQKNMGPEWKLKLPKLGQNLASQLIYTYIHIYIYMPITSISRPKKAKNGDALGHVSRRPQIVGFLLFFVKETTIA